MRNRWVSGYPGTSTVTKRDPKTENHPHGWQIPTTQQPTPTPAPIGRGEVRGWGGWCGALENNPNKGGQECGGIESCY